ncbi:MAG: TetR/AcrR family transcriptional regulator [Microthrixaceae bacterium]
MATDRILDAAAGLFTSNGVSSTTMAQVATAAGCSRATLYNHFSDRRQLEIAFVHREAIRLSARVGERTASLSDPAQRIRAAFQATLEEVRSDPRLLAWFSATDAGLATEISADSEVLDAIAAAFAGSVTHSLDTEDLARRARWVLRLVLSLLTMPEPDPAEEPRLIDDFVVPALLGS